MFIFLFRFLTPPQSYPLPQVPLEDTCSQLVQVTTEQEFGAMNPLDRKVANGRYSCNMGFTIHSS